MKRLALFLLAAILVLCAGAAMAEEYYAKTWLLCPAYGYGTDVQVLVVTNDPGQKAKTEADFAGEILYYPFDAAAGLYALSGEPAGERAEILSLNDNRIGYTVRLKEPGKYTLSGAAYYLFDRTVPEQTGLRAELDGAAAASVRKEEKDTARALHDWVCDRISPAIPEEDAARLGEACRDPMNALLTGYAGREAYAELYSILLGAEGIRSLTVSGTAGEENGTWNLCRIDGVWSWSDPAADDVNDQRSTRYALMDDPALAKDHALCPADERFTAERIRSLGLDALLEGTLDPSMLKTYKEQGRNIDIAVHDGPVWVVGDSATVSFRLYTNKGEEYRKMTPEEFLEKNVTYYPWLAEEMERDVEIPPVSELVTVEEAAEDMSTFTLTFHTPGRYVFFDFYPDYFYLISPDQEELVTLAAEMDAVVEKAKAGRTEKEIASRLYNWIQNKVRYNYPAYRWWENDVTARDMQTCEEAFGALLYGKCICGGYANSYAILMRHAGLTELTLNGLVGTNEFDLDGHDWNLNRLDGEWTYTDVTWDRFAWPKDRMRKDHDDCLGFVAKDLFDSVAFDTLANEAEEDRQQLQALPAALKVLPGDVSGYGFPEQVPDFMKVEVEPTEDGTVIRTDRSAKITIGRPFNGAIGQSTAITSEQFVREFKSTNKLDKTRIEAATYEQYAAMRPKITRNEQMVSLEYMEGNLTGNWYRLVVPIGKNELPDTDEYSYRFYEYDADMNPYSAGWHLMKRGDVVATLDLQVFFGADGKAERYEAAYSNYALSIDTRWEGTADGAVTSVKGKDPKKAKPTDWEQIWFE